tara:strand:- start:29 stop:220 length:192 start_codon:yes stop_codon:yes gene_type:complete
MELEVYKKSNWGKVLIYPACQNAKVFTELTGQKTFSELQIKQIKKLGYNFKEVLPVFDEVNII